MTLLEASLTGCCTICTVSCPPTETWETLDTFNEVLALAEADEATADLLTLRALRLNIMDSAPGSNFQYEPRPSLEDILGTLVKLLLSVKLCLMEFCQLRASIL